VLADLYFLSCLDGSPLIVIARSFWIIQSAGRLGCLPC
jgi:hypothetical protein